MSTNYTNNTNKRRSSFTLIELLVVLALVAILSVVVVMTLNPAELIKQARDSNRLSDLSTINTALNLFSADVTGGFMGTSTVVYVSIPDNASSTCGSLGLPTLPSGWNYNCVTTANLRNTNGTGWIPVNLQRISSNSPISQLPIDPINTTTTLNYYTYVTGGSWKLSVLSLESQKYQTNAQTDGGTAAGSFELGTDLTLGGGIFPVGWIKVPGNSTFGKSDFWVMKYEAKCASSTAPSVGLIAPDTGSGYNTYANNSAACTGVRTVTSVPGGYPITNINQATAAAYCQSIGAHLISNNEWQTIAWNVQNVASNWSGGAVGSGYLGKGNSDSSAAQVASINDADTTYLVTGNFAHRRTHTLSNGQIIWDLAGNVWEWNSDTIIGTNKPVGTSGNWKEWKDVVNFGSLSRAAYGSAVSTWGASENIGPYYQGNLDGNTYGFLRGGGWFSGWWPGVETAALDQLTSFTYYADGFRCAR